MLLAMTFVVGTVTLATGRATLLQGALHLVVFGSFVLLTIIP